MQGPADSLQVGSIQLHGVIPAKQKAEVLLEAALGAGVDGVALSLLTFCW